MNLPILLSCMKWDNDMQRENMALFWRAPQQQLSRSVPILEPSEMVTAGK